MIKDMLECDQKMLPQQKLPLQILQLSVYAIYMQRIKMIYWMGLKNEAFRLTEGCIILSKEVKLRLCEWRHQERVLRCNLYCRCDITSGKKSFYKRENGVNNSRKWIVSCISSSFLQEWNHCWRVLNWR